MGPTTSPASRASSVSAGCRRWWWRARADTTRGPQECPREGPPVPRRAALRGTGEAHRRFDSPRTRPHNRRHLSRQRLDLEVFMNSRRDFLTGSLAVAGASMLPRHAAAAPKSMTVVRESSFIKPFDDYFAKTLAAE